MKNILSDIKNHEFKRVYLLCGNEAYLITKCRNLLVNGVLGGSDKSSSSFSGSDQTSDSNMNLSYYDGTRGFDIRDLTESLMSYPFFSDKRIVIAENSGLFSAANADFADTVSEIPDTTVFVLTEPSPDKRTRLYKAIGKTGYICELNTPDQNEILNMLSEHFASCGKKITRRTLDLFTDYVGGELFNLINEADKLSDYTGNRENITEDDIRAICTMQTENRIFDIIDNLIAHNKRKALNIYFNLIALREAPLGILRSLMSQFNRLLLIRDGIDNNLSDAEIASSGKIPPFVVRRSRPKIRDLSRRAILSALVQCLNTEESIKSGDISDSTGIEILLANLSSL